MDKIIVGIIVLAAVWYLYRRFKNMLNPEKGCGCDCGCGNACSQAGIVDCQINDNKNSCNGLDASETGKE